MVMMMAVVALRLTGLRVGLQRVEGLLRGRDVTALECLADGVEILRQRRVRRRRHAALLDGLIRGLRRREIAVLNGLCQVLEVGPNVGVGIVGLRRWGYWSNVHRKNPRA